MEFTSKELRLLRQCRNLLQKNVAKRMGISTQRYSSLENNDRRPRDRTVEILRALNLNENTARRILDSISK